MKFPAPRSTTARLVVATLAAAAIIAGCAESTDLTAPELQLVNARDAGTPTGPLPSLAAYECVKANVRKDAQGRRVGWDVGSRRADVNRRANATGASLSVYGMWVFDGDGQQVAEARCFIERSDSSRATLRNFYKGALGKTKRPATSGIFANIDVGSVCEWETIGGSYTGDVICDGVTRCTQVYAALRIGSALRQSAPTQYPMPHFDMAFSCSGGGMLYVTGGSATYVPPSSGGGGGGGGGGGCGGGGGEGGDPNDSIWDEFRSSNLALLCPGDTVPVMPPNMCYPEGWQTATMVVPDTLCYRKLSVAESLAVRYARDSLMVPLNQIADSATRAACAAGWAGFDAMLARGDVFGALSDTPLGSTGQERRHEAMRDSLGRMHVETWQFTDFALPINQFPLNFKAELALSLVHEGLHEAGWAAHSTNEPYTTPPWSYFNSMKYDKNYWNGGVTGVTKSPCVKWKTS